MGKVNYRNLAGGYESQSWNTGFNPISDSGEFRTGLYVKQAMLNLSRRYPDRLVPSSDLTDEVHRMSAPDDRVIDIGKVASHLDYIEVVRTAKGTFYKLTQTGFSEVVMPDLDREVRHAAVEAIIEHYYKENSDEVWMPQEALFQRALEINPNLSEELLEDKLVYGEHKDIEKRPVGKGRYEFRYVLPSVPRE